MFSFHRLAWEQLAVHHRSELVPAMATEAQILTGLAVDSKDHIPDGAEDVPGSD